MGIACYMWWVERNRIWFRKIPSIEGIGPNRQQYAGKFAARAGTRNAKGMLGTAGT
jgi:hypothetical protein